MTKWSEFNQAELSWWFVCERKQILIKTFPSTSIITEYIKPIRTNYEIYFVNRKLYQEKMKFAIKFSIYVVRKSRIEIELKLFNWSNNGRIYENNFSRIDRIAWWSGFKIIDFDCSLGKKSIFLLVSNCERWRITIKTQTIFTNQISLSSVTNGQRTNAYSLNLSHPLSKKKQNLVLS